MMFDKFWLLVMLALAGIANSCSEASPYSAIEFSANPQPLPVITDDGDKGYELGVSAMFSGIVDDVLIVAGGCNFPDKPVAEGGKKRFYDGVYAYQLNDSVEYLWERIGSLPKPVAYGAFVEWNNRLICIGGQTAEGATADVFALGHDNGLIIEPLASLPCAIDNAYATLLGDVVYVAGGNADGVPSDAVYALDLASQNEGWKMVTTLPDGPRVQPVLAGLGGKLYVMGGFCNKQGETAYVSRTAWSYDLAKEEWLEQAAPAAFVGGGCAMVLDGSHILCAGGVNADIFERAIRGEFPNPEYLLHPKEWYHFNDILQCYNVKTGVWHCMGEYPQLARAGAGIVALADGFVMVQGEEKPGIRSPQMTRFSRQGLDSALAIVDQLPLLPRPQHIVYGSGRCYGDSLSLVKNAKVEMVDGLQNDEAYVLDVTATGISIKAMTEQGAYWAKQTLAQLAIYDNGAFAGFMGCHVEDWPSFRIRGFLQDVGRSYISIEELKKEIAILSRYKINVFHWHLTENQAYRLESKKYPQLNDPAITTRMPGKFYTHEEARDLVEFCRQHGMMLIPEIDVPGHSAAFDRAFGFSMQSEQGVPIVRDLLTEACEVFDVPYLHLGTDEVRFTNSDFVPEMVALVRSKGKKVISYNPGWKYDVGEIDMTHLWSYRGKAQPGIPAIDSKFHYLNHFDTFADLVSLYGSRIYNTPQGNDDIAGAILALWHDRLSPTESDMIRNNHLYPNMLAIAERAWLGGGYEYFDGLGTIMPPRGSKDFNAFADFEDRMIWHLSRYCDKNDFVYVKQSAQEWAITDAFPNKGNFAAVFPPETEPLPESVDGALYIYKGKEYNVGTASGAGVYLRHVWGTFVPGYYDDPQPNHTAYAYTWVYSDCEQTVGLLAETQNYSRSEKDFPPVQGTLDYRGSRIWVNGEEIAPPHWSNQTMEHDNELPLGNENLAVREPIAVHLNQGWNSVLLKLPIGEFNTPEVRLVKWMFAATFTTPDGREAAKNIRYSVDKK